MLRSVHAAVCSGNPVPAWPEVIPAAYRERLRLRRGLRDRLDAYGAAFSALSPADRLAVKRALAAQNNIGGLLQGRCSCVTADQLPASIRGALVEMSGEAFRLLGEYGIRDNQYRVIYEQLGHKVCPFCGLECFDSPEGPREDMDHFLSRSRYPFAAVNAKNLVPMGGRCNSAYKGTADVLWNGAVRRPAFLPYNHTGVLVSLAGTQPFGGARNGAHPQWNVSFAPQSAEAETWDSVFRIRERYVRDVLEPRYEPWLQRFADFCRAANLATGDTVALIEALNRFRQFNKAEGFSDRGFLKAALCELLVRHCEEGNQRLIGLLQDAVSGA